MAQLRFLPRVKTNELRSKNMRLLKTQAKLSQTADLLAEERDRTARLGVR